MIVRAPATARCTRSSSWHVDVVDAKRCEYIEDGVDYGLRRGDAAGLAGALDAEGLDRRRLLGERHV